MKFLSIGLVTVAVLMLLAVAYCYYRINRWKRIIADAKVTGAEKTPYARHAEERVQKLEWEKNLMLDAFFFLSVPSPLLLCLL